MFKKVLLTATTLALLGTASNASIVSYTPNVVEIVRPAAVGQPGPADNAKIIAFNEKQRFELTSDLVTNLGGTIAAGTIVDSHMVLFNKDVRSSLTLAQSGSIVFSGLVLGIISMRDTLLASDFLGAPTVYEDFQNRGLDEGKLDVVGFTGDTVNATFYINNPGDWIRVITVATVPVPAAGLFLGMGLAGLFGLRRRRKMA